MRIVISKPELKAYVIRLYSMQIGKIKYFKRLSELDGQRLKEEQREQGKIPIRSVKL